MNGLDAAAQLRVGQILKIPAVPAACTVILPDLDRRPAFVDLATGEMIVMPEGIEKDQDLMRKHLTQLTKGDLGFDRQLIALRGGHIRLWDGTRADPLASRAQADFNSRSYDLPRIPCRLLVTTGDDKVFDVMVVKTTSDGSLEIQYVPFSAKAMPVEADAADRACAAALKELLALTRTGIAAYELDNGKHPDLTAGWITMTESAGKGPYVRAAPVNPFTGGWRIASDASADWQWDSAAGTLKAVVPLGGDQARRLGLDPDKDVVAAAADAPVRNVPARIQLPPGTSRRVSYALDKIDSLMRYVESQKDGDIAVLSGYFDQINEFCDNLQGKNGAAVPGRDEWGGLDDAQIEAVLKLLSDVEQAAEGCRELARGGHKQLLISIGNYSNMNTAVFARNSRRHPPARHTSNPAAPAACVPLHPGPAAGFMLQPFL